MSGNYPNMSYTMCNNTLLALRQVITAMQYDGPQFLQELSKDERRKFGELFTACEEFMQLSEELEEEYEREVREALRDEQPDEQQEWADFDPDC